MQKKAIIILLVSAIFTGVFAQVTISPTSLFIDSSRRFETLLIANGSNVAQEVKLSWEFGYPISDEVGNISMVYGDEKEAALHSAADWIRGFPKNFILEPGARQTIRITVKAPRDLEPGTYWSRLKTTSSALSAAVGSTQPGGITTQINFQFNQITSVFYKQGELSTGINLKGATSSVDDKTQLLRVIADFEKIGNSPFLGTLDVKIFDVTGAVVRDGQVYVSIYYDGKRRHDLDVSDLPMGSYDVEVGFISKRSDIPDAQVVSVPTVTTRTTFTKL